MFIAIVVVYAWAAGSRFDDGTRSLPECRIGRRGSHQRSTAVVNQARRRRVCVCPPGCGLTSFHLVRAGVLGFLALMTWAESQGLSRHWIGPIFLSSP